MFDTHCHLNFKVYRQTLDAVIERAKTAGITDIVIPGTDVPTSRKAVAIASSHPHMYAAVGIHPHHAYKIMKLHEEEQKAKRRTPATLDELIDREIAEIQSLADDPSVVAIGEIGMDAHVYEHTVYGEYSVDSRFMQIQKKVCESQMRCAIQKKKSIIFHNREAKKDILKIITSEWDDVLRGHTVFHCCEPDEELLDFARTYGMYIGVDGDLTYFEEKQEFIKKIPLEMLVIETDAPFLLPEPLKSEKKYPNEPSYLPYVVEKIAELKNVSADEIITVTARNARLLFNL